MIGQKGDLGFEKCESSFEDLVEAVNLNNRNHSGNCHPLVMNVIHLKHDQFKINAVEFSDLREEAFTRLCFAISSFFRKLSTGKDFTRF